MPPPLETGNIGIGNISTFPHFLYPDGGDFGIIQHALVRHPLRGRARRPAEPYCPWQTTQRSENRRKSRHRLKQTETRRGTLHGRAFR